jgi:hypothetical protein
VALKHDRFYSPEYREDRPLCQRGAFVPRAEYREPNALELAGPGETVTCPRCLKAGKASTSSAVIARAIIEGAQEMGLNLTVVACGSVVVFK